MSCGCLDCDITVPIGPQGATGPQGPAGTNGTNGSDGVSVLYNTFLNLATSTTGSFEILDTYTLPINTLSVNGDQLEIESMFLSSSGDAFARLVQQSFGVNTICPYGTVGGFPILGSFHANNIVKINLKSRFVRTSNTTAKIQSELTFIGTSYNQVLKMILPLQSLAGLNFTTNTYGINAEANSVVTGDITLESFKIILYKQQ